MFLFHQEKSEYFFNKYVIKQIHLSEYFPIILIKEINGLDLQILNGGMEYKYEASYYRVTQPWSQARKKHL